MRGIAIVMGVVTAILGAGSLASAREGFYLGFQLPYETIGGDFDGSSALVSPSDVVILPDVDSAFGWGFVFGYGAAPELDFEFAYSSVGHDSTWLGGSFDVRHQAFNVNGKLNFLTMQRLQPNLGMGLAYHRLVVENGSTDGFSVGDATYTGLGLDLSAGVDAYANSAVSVGAVLVYHWIPYSHAEGLLTSGTTENDVDGSGLGVILRAVYHF